MQFIVQVFYLGQLHGLDQATARKRSLTWCERLQISDAIEKKTEELSKGMQQKIQFIAALLHEPSIPSTRRCCRTRSSICGERARRSCSRRTAWTR